VAINNAMIQYRPGAKSQVYVNAHPGMLFYGDPGVSKSGRPMSKTLFAPRVGLSYSLTSDQKTVLRSGYGIYYNPTWSNVEGQFAIYQPFTRIIDIVTPPSTANPWGNFPGGNPHPYTPDKNAIFDNGIVGLTYGPGFTEPMMQQWNLNIQRELRENWLVTLGYAGPTRTTAVRSRRTSRASVRSSPSRIRVTTHCRLRSTSVSAGALQSCWPTRFRRRSTTSTPCCITTGPARTRTAARPSGLRRAMTAPMPISCPGSGPCPAAG
jgi:hypothetical protein